MEIPDAAARGTISKNLMLLPEKNFRKTDAVSSTIETNLKLLPVTKYRKT
jgi:hypothetical protein